MKRLLYLPLFIFLICGMITAAKSVEYYTKAWMDPAKEETTEWNLLADDVTATVYNAVPKQCNADYTHTASMFKIDTKNVQKHRIIAMERTMMKEYGISYGDTLKILGTGIHDGLWQVQDTMNKRYAGQHRIDFLVPTALRHGKWQNVRIYRRNRKE